MKTNSKEELKDTVVELLHYEMWIRQSEELILELGDSVKRDLNFHLSLFNIEKKRLQEKIALLRMMSQL